MKRWVIQCRKCGRPIPGAIVMEGPTPPSQILAGFKGNRIRCGECKEMAVYDETSSWIQLKD